MAHLARRLALVVPLLLAVSAIAPPGAIGEAGEAAPAADSALALGREALARGDYGAAERQLARAVETLDPATDGAALAEAYLDLGIARLQGSGAAEKALVAFLHSAELAEQPATAYLWAAAAARRLGLAEEARRYEDRALARPMAPALAEPAPADSAAASPAAPGEPPPAGAPGAPAERLAAPGGTGEPSGEAAFHLLFGGSRAAPAPPPAAPSTGKAAAAPAAAPAPKEGPAARPEGEPPEKPLDVFELLFGPRKPKPAAAGTRGAADEPPPPPPSAGE